MYKRESKSSSCPCTGEVDSFMTRMFGFNPSMTWKVVGISESEVPGVARVLITIGNQPTPNAFYIMPGGKFAMVGEVIPFGADPFAPVRSKLNTEAHGPMRGSASAAVTMVEFSDLQCPHCKA